ncbi:putative DNA-binding transcriptional regulator YafY [Streptomyces sp. SAI-126]|nr:putative DNA-binding transcriptional regulator YafY [Streptomyces sp. SAI-119]MDH6496391.1 putative DNA-binding transcriptional regulator YafY [Streptomyces sp. SAI-149]
MAALPAPHCPAAEATSRRVLVDATRWQGGPQPAVDLDVLQDAVFADRRLRLRYRHSGERTTRTYTVDPYGLVSKAGVWYLVADRRGLPRLFRADRVHSAAVLDTPVKRRPGVELADAWAVLRRRVEERPGGIDVTVRVRRDRLDLFLRLMAPYLRELPEDDGASAWVTARLRLGVVGEARQLLQFSDRVEVLAPPEVREEVARAAASVTALYQPVGGRSGRNPSSTGLL